MGGRQSRFNRFAYFRGYHECIMLLLAALFISTACTAANSPPEIASYPTVSVNPIVANNTAVYSVTVTIRDADGYSDLNSIRILFNFTEANPDQTKGRGYLAWATSDALITKYGGTWTIADAGGGGRWGYRTDTWGGVTYITPLSCGTATSGSATGGTGTRTVTWTFRAKAAWAWNPLTNDADVWASDATVITGWRDNPSEFDVVAAPCAGRAPDPREPVISDPTDSTVKVAINPADSDMDRYCIKISPAVDDRAYVQADGSLGGFAVWQTKSEWGTKTVRGLLSSTNYTVRVRAVGDQPDRCPSGFGPEASFTTAKQNHSINAAAPGKQMHRGVIGNATRLDFFPNNLQSWQKLWEVLPNTCARGIAGGLDIDTYNWKDMSGQGVGHTGTPGPDVPTTLAWMRLARDHQSMPLIGVNTRGIGPLESSGWCRFYYTDISTATVEKLAADWIRYINFILPTYRQGDSIPPGDQAILDSINWYGRPKLLDPGEAATPKVTYWEIGNEPEVPLPWCTSGATTFSPSPSEYALRCKKIAAAMRAVDPSAKIGPCITTANNGNAWLDAVLADTAIPVDFISYHPYGPLYWYANNYGDTVETAEKALRAVRQGQIDAYNGIMARINASPRDPSSIKLIASEYNPSDWHWECSPQIRRMSHALALAETLFTFADLGLFAANYWSHPAWCKDGTETPGYKVFEMAQELWGERLIDSYSDGNTFRLYTTWNPKTREIVTWGLNFSNSLDKPVRVSLTGTGSVKKIIRNQLAKLTGSTSLLDTNDPPYTAPPNIDWTTTDLTGTLDPSNFEITFPDSTITILIFTLGGSIAQARASPDGSRIGVDSAVVTAAFPDFFYVESDDRACGIRVRLDGHTIQQGMRADISGLIETTPTGEREIAAEYVVQNGTGDIWPLGANNRTIGCGVCGGTGTDSTGLLVRTWGKVLQINPDEHSIIIDDGSGGSLKCVAPKDVVLDPAWRYLVVTGISSCEVTADQPQRVLLIRDMSDIQEVAPPDLLS